MNINTITAEDLRRMPDKANASIKRFKIPKRKQHSYPLRGKVFCGSCKHAMHRSNETIYRCRFSYMDSSQPCYGMTIRESELESIEKLE